VTIVSNRVIFSDFCRSANVLNRRGVAIHCHSRCTLSSRMIVTKLPRELHSAHDSRSKQVSRRRFGIGALLNDAVLTAAAADVDAVDAEAVVDDALIMLLMS
jgi:hypothetical protein